MNRRVGEAQLGESESGKSGRRAAGSCVIERAAEPRKPAAR